MVQVISEENFKTDIGAPEKKLGISKSWREPQKIKNWKKEFDLVELFLAYHSPIIPPPLHHIVKIRAALQAWPGKRYTSPPKQSGHGAHRYPTQSPHGSSSCSVTLRPTPHLHQSQSSDQYLTKTLQYYSQSDQALTIVANKYWQYRTNLYNSLIVVIH